MSEWRKVEWSVNEQEWWAIANSRSQIEQSWRASGQVPATPSVTSVRIDPIAVQRVPRRPIEPIGIQPWQAELTPPRFRPRAPLPLKRSQVELPQFASRR